VKRFVQVELKQNLPNPQDPQREPTGGVHADPSFRITWHWPDWPLQ